MGQLIKSWLFWLEGRWLAPAYGGGVLLGLAIAFLGAAVNTMAGWLYAISGAMMAIALVSLWLPPRNLQDIRVQRASIPPVSVGDTLTLTVLLENPTASAKVLLKVQDYLPVRLGEPAETAIAAILPRSQWPWQHSCQPQRRGVYRWDTVFLRTAAPLGLFWCRRAHSVPACAIVYPQILPLQRCPLIEEFGISAGQRQRAPRQTVQASDGLTRALRPYRWGDPIRLIHWRTSARYGELRVRELEQSSSDSQILIALDASSDRWSEDAFESAVVAAASLYSFSLQRQLPVTLWLPHTGTRHRKHDVLTALAEVMPNPATSRPLPNHALIWLSPGGASPQKLPPGSLWVCWPQNDDRHSPRQGVEPALTIRPESAGRSLLAQLQDSR